MFGKLKERLNSWFKSSAKKVEETAEVVETEDEKEEEIKEDFKKDNLESSSTEINGESGDNESEGDDDSSSDLEDTSKIAEKADKIIEESKDDKVENVPVRFNIGLEKYEPDMEKISEKADRLIEKAKGEHYEKPFLKYDKLNRQNVPDEEKIKEEAGKLSEEIENAKEIESGEKEIKENVLKEKGNEVEISEKESEEKKSFFSRLKYSFSYKISENEFDEIFDDLEMLLIENNIALEVVDDLKIKLADKLIGREVKKQDLESTIREELKNSLNEIIIEPDNPLDVIKNSKKPFVILFFGVNGVGKTTAIAKITYFLKKSGYSVVLAAADTFRAASIEQLTEHAEKLGVPIIKHDYKADPAAVGYDAIKYAKNKKIDVVLIDTAGRMHTKANLLEEMKKIERVTEPDLSIFVTESIAGNDATEQAKAFNETIEIDGSILSKADIDEKGGTIISVSHAINKPIFYLGTGQEYEDLELFNKQKYIESLGL